MRGHAAGTVSNINWMFPDSKACIAGPLPARHVSHLRTGSQVQERALEVTAGAVALRTVVHRRGVGLEVLRQLGQAMLTGRSLLATSTLAKVTACVIGVRSFIGW